MTASGDIQSVEWLQKHVIIKHLDQKDDMTMNW